MKKIMNDSEIVAMLKDTAEKENINIVDYNPSTEELKISPLVRNEADMTKLIEYAEKVGSVKINRIGGIGYIPDELLAGFAEYRDGVDDDDEDEAGEDDETFWDEVEEYYDDEEDEDVMKHCGKDDCYCCERKNGHCCYRWK